MLLALALIFAAPTNYPAYTDYVVDAANVLDAGAQAHLKQVASQLDHAGIAQVAVLTITDAMLGDDSIEDYAVSVFKKWGLGHDKKRSDGVLVVFKPGAAGHRLTKVETGYGAEGVLPDGKVGALIDQYARPSVRKNDYGQAAVQLVDAIAAVLQNDAAAGGDMAPTAGGRRGGTNQGMRGNPVQPDNLGGLAVTVLCMLGLVIALATSGSRRQFPGKKTQAAALGLTGVSVASLIFAGSGAGFIVLVLGLIAVAVIWASIRAHKCPKDGSWMTIDEEILDQPTYWSDGLAHVSQRCTNARCGYRNDYDKRIPRKQMTVVTGGGGGGGGGGFGGGGGDGFSGGGGGESGGGGASRSD